MNRYLVTGATGVVGSAFVERLLRETKDSAMLVIRTKRDVNPAERLDALFRFWQLGAAGEADARKRVKVIAGDTEQPKLGLSAQDWKMATKAATHVVHSAAIVKMNLPLEAARKAAVASVESVLSFAREAKALKKVELVSTVGIGGRRAQVLEENWLETPRGFHNTYEEAKAAAEVVAHAGLDEGLPLTVLRPSMVVGDSRSGKIIAPQIFSYLCEFLTGTRVHGVFPPLTRARLDVVPVDWVTKLLLVSSQTPSWVGQVLHACSGTAAVPLVELRERVHRIATAHGRRVLNRVTLPLDAFKKARTLGDLLGAKKTSQLLDILLAYLEDDQRFANTKTLELAKSVGLTLPHPSTYLDTVLWEAFSAHRSP